MAEPIADNADFAVEELKRKARRRLVGAVVLALAAATLVPLLLEQEQKPLGDDVSVQIPPVDSGKFVSKLSGDQGRIGTPDAAPATPATPSTGTSPAAGAATAPAAAGTAPSASPPPAADKTAAMPTPPPAPAAAAKAPGASTPPAVAAKTTAAAPLASTTTLSDAGSDAKSESPTAAPEAKPEAKPDAAATPSPAPKAEGFVVQLGAFTDNYGANALAARLKKSGYPAYTEPVESRRGKLWRVRVGGFPTRQAANETLNKLKAEGQDGRVVSAK